MSRASSPTIDASSKAGRLVATDDEKAVDSTSTDVPGPSHWSVFPDGGARAWSTVAGAWLTLFATFGVLSSFGVFEDFYVREYITSKSPSTIAWIGSIQLCLQFCVGLLVGRPFDEGYFRHLITIGSVIYVVCIFMLSLAKPDKFYQVFLAQGVGAGIGIGMLFLPTVSIVTHHFNKRRALANGITFTGASVSGVVFPILMNKFFHGSVGFANGMRICAGIVSAALLGGWLLMRTRLPPKSQMLDRPPAPNPAVFFRERDFVAGAIGLALIQMGVYFPTFYIQLDAASHGVAKDRAFDTLTILNAASAVGRLLPNLFADKVGITNTLICSGTICSALIVATLAFDTGSPATVLVLAGLYGFFSGTYVSLIGPLIASFAKSVHEIGLRGGIVFMFLGVVSLVGTPINGALLGDGPVYHWWKSVVFSASVIAGGVLFLLYVRYVHARERGTPYV